MNILYRTYPKFLKEHVANNIYHDVIYNNITCLIFINEENIQSLYQRLYSIHSQELNLPFSDELFSSFEFETSNKINIVNIQNKNLLPINNYLLENKKNYTIYLDNINNLPSFFGTRFEKLEVFKDIIYKYNLDLKYYLLWNNHINKKLKDFSNKTIDIKL